MRPTSRRRSAAFTLVEVAVVLAIVALLLGSLMYTLSAQVEQRDFEDSRRRLGVDALAEVHGAQGDGRGGPLGARADPGLER